MAAAGRAVDGRRARLSVHHLHGDGRTGEDDAAGNLDSGGRGCRDQARAGNGVDEKQGERSDRRRDFDGRLAASAALGQIRDDKGILIVRNDSGIGPRLATLLGLVEHRVVAGRQRSPGLMNRDDMRDVAANMPASDRRHTHAPARWQRHSRRAFDAGHALEHDQSHYSPRRPPPGRKLVPIAGKRLPSRRDARDARRFSMASTITSIDPSAFSCVSTCAPE